MQQLLEALDQRGTDQDTQRRFDQQMWADLGADGAVLVTDLTGFTATTRSRGILHFLAIFRRCQKICVPIINKHGGSMLKQEADDLIGLFEEVEDALGAGIEMIERLDELNAGLAPDEQVGICVGMEYGRFLRLDDDAFGDPVNVAFKLGEDLADRGEVLIGATAHARAVARGFDFSRHSVDGPRRRFTGNVEIEHYALRPARAEGGGA